MERTEAAIAALEAQNKGSNAEPPSPMPPELRRAHSLQERVRAAQERLASQEQQKKVNLTDGDARFMKGQQGIIPGYNPRRWLRPLHESPDELRTSDLGQPELGSRTDHMRIIIVLA